MSAQSVPNHTHAGLRMGPSGTRTLYDVKSPLFSQHPSNKYLLYQHLTCQKQINVPSEFCIYSQCHDDRGCCSTIRQTPVPNRPAARMSHFSGDSNPNHHPTTGKAKKHIICVAAGVSPLCPTFPSSRHSVTSPRISHARRISRTLRILPARRISRTLRTRSPHQLSRSKNCHRSTPVLALRHLHLHYPAKPFEMSNPVVMEVWLGDDVHKICTEANLRDALHNVDTTVGGDRVAVAPAAIANTHLER